METIKIKAELVEPTGIVHDGDAMTLYKIQNYPARIVLTIGDYVWMFTQDGKIAERIVPHDDE